MHITLIAAMSVDGKIAQSADQLSLDWTSKEDFQFFVEKTKELGTVIMGRKTWETIGRPLKDRRTIVMTRHKITETDLEGVEFTNEALQELIERLKAEEVETVALCGGASIYSLFLRQGLVDEMYLTVEPIMFGSGVPLAEGFDQIDLELIDSTLLGQQAVLLHYKVK
ncbi:dihydrofolate reductase family protein [Patescibacteria group bacterium]